MREKIHFLLRVKASQERKTIQDLVEEICRKELGLQTLEEFREELKKHQ